MKRWIILISILAIAAVGGAGYYGYRSSQPPVVVPPQAPPTTPVTTCTVEQTVNAPGSLVNTNETKIEMPVTGRLAEVLVKPGDTVTAGQVLARLDDVQQLAAAVAADQLAVLQAQQDRAVLDQNAPLQIAQAQVAVQDAQTALQNAQDYRAGLNNPRSDPMTINKLQAQLALDANNVTMAQDNFNRVAGFDASDPRYASAQLALINAKQVYHDAQVNLDYYQGTPSQADIADADAKLALVQANLAKAQAALAAIQNGPASLDVALADAKVSDAKAALASDQKALDNVDIKAPFAGVILDVTAAVGETTASGAPLFTLNNPQAVEVESTVTEDDYPYVDLGQPVSIFFDALPDATITGKVARIVPINAGGGTPLYDIYLSLDQVPAKVVEGMSADASISIAQRKNVLCLPRAVVQASANGTAVVQVWADGQTQQVDVKVGLRGDTTVEILSGLKEGDLVVTQ